MNSKHIRQLAFALLLPAALHAQLGSPDVFLDTSAGSSRMTISVKTPQAIPGIASLEIQSEDKAVNSLKIVPMPIGGEGTTFLAEPQFLTRSELRPNLFTGSVTILAPGSWKLRVDADGDRGRGILFVPIPFVMRSVRSMSIAYAAMVWLLCLLLAAGAVAIAGAGAREGSLPVGQAPGRMDKIRGRIGMTFAAALLALAFYGGYNWWNAEASQYAKQVYRPPSFLIDVNAEGTMFASVTSDGWSKTIGDLVPEQEHFMHMFVVSLPAMEKVWRVHPDMQVSGVFTMKLPAMDAGKYWAFGDILHTNGFPETVSTAFELKEPITGGRAAGDDSQASAPPAGKNTDPGTSVLTEKYRVILVHTDQQIKAGETTRLQFRIEGRNGRPAEDLEMYLGMPAQAAVIKHDRTVFALLNPSGTAPMAAVRLVSALFVRPPEDHASHSMNMGVPAEFSMPYAFPSAGNYRIFLQVKRRGLVETATFDVTAVE